MSLTQGENTTFNHPPTHEDLLAEYTKSQQNDPSSIHYKRKLVRPKLHLFKVLCLTFLVLVLAGLISFGFFWLTNNRVATILTFVILVVATIIVFLKSIIIWFVHVYQRFASDKRRERCRFEPSCSEYMILALEKYGVVKGLKKGISRLRRCKPPNGGFDPP